MTEKPRRRPNAGDQNSRRLGANEIRARINRQPVSLRPSETREQVARGEQPRKPRAVLEIFSERQRRHRGNAPGGRAPLPPMPLSELPSLKALLDAPPPCPHEVAKKHATTSDGKRMPRLCADSCIVAQGDIVVTGVGELYTIGRVTAAAKIQAFVETRPDRRAALKRACQLARDEHRVFIAHSSRHTSTLVDCGALEHGRIDAVASRRCRNGTGGR